jgi:hypothetical protein
MRDPRNSSAWLSNDMAHALAAACPPLNTTHVAEAADRLTARLSSTFVIEHLLRQGGDLKNVQQVVEALRALRDVREQAGGRDLRLPRRRRRGASAETGNRCPARWL